MQNLTKGLQPQTGRAHQLAPSHRFLGRWTCRATVVAHRGCIRLRANPVVFLVVFHTEFSLHVGVALGFRYSRWSETPTGGCEDHMDRCLLGEYILAY